MSFTKFTNFFGKSKKQPDHVATTEKLSETLRSLETKEKLLQKKIAAELEKAKAFTKANNKRAAIQCLKRKKLYEQQLEHIVNSQWRIHEQITMIESAKCTTDTVVALRTGAGAMKKMQKEMKINDVDKTMDEINAQSENLKQIQEAIAAPISGQEFDEADLEAELEELEGLELEEQLLQPAPVVSQYVPAKKQPARMAPCHNTAEEDELAALTTELAL
ncbi:vacuolar protein sorting-associated protein 32 homolog 2 [Tanacetum coccineum]|uniref:Vacuolar protein sorting-associated protein 32 homolog 2 n=1 Tax=Tanacetum coccineum TaxID=301880 RepID=A0ABQ5CX27_9ASTR